MDCKIQNGNFVEIQLRSSCFCYFIQWKISEWNIYFPCWKCGAPMQVTRKYFIALKSDSGWISYSLENYIGFVLTSLVGVTYQSLTKQSNLSEITSITSLHQAKNCYHIDGSSNLVHCAIKSTRKVFKSGELGRIDKGCA